MAQSFVACDREQELLLPSSLREWLPEGHLAWFVIDAVAQGGLVSGAFKTIWVWRRTFGRVIVSRCS